MGVFSSFFCPVKSAPPALQAHPPAQHTLPCTSQLRSFPPQCSKELVSLSSSAAWLPRCLCCPSNWGDLWRSWNAAENSHILGWLPKEMHQPNK